MQTITSIADMQSAARALQLQGKRMALVPTMGFLHEGHLSLMRIAKEHADVVIVSLFVNPTQFGPNEDYDAYPRDVDRDTQLCEREGVDILFSPDTTGMYTGDDTVYVDEDSMSKTLCGRTRPGHFRGVLTVVAKLFNIASPDVAVFGQKDAQQLALIRSMTKALNFPVEIVGAPIVREADGIAMSSRNAYLSDAERKQAVVLHEALGKVQEAHGAGERSAHTLKSILTDHLATAPLADLDYAEIVDATSLQPIDKVTSPALVAVAVRFGKARLIDNLLIEP